MTISYSFYISYQLIHVFFIYLNYNISIKYFQHIVCYIYLVYYYAVPFKFTTMYSYKYLVYTTPLTTYLLLRLNIYINDNIYSQTIILIKLNTVLCIVIYCYLRYSLLLGHCSARCIIMRSFFIKYAHYYIIVNSLGCATIIYIYTRVALFFYIVTLNTHRYLADNYSLYYYYSNKLLQWLLFLFNLYCKLFISITLCYITVILLHLFTALVLTYNALFMCLIYILWGQSNYFSLCLKWLPI